jgi:hypothetical protein
MFLTFCQSAVLFQIRFYLLQTCMDIVGCLRVYSQNCEYNSDDTLTFGTRITFVSTTVEPMDVYVISTTYSKISISEPIVEVD